LNFVDRINPETIHRISLERLLKKYGTGKRRERMEPVYQTMLMEVEELSTPEAIYEKFPSEMLSELSPWLYEDAPAVVLGLCTLGPKVQMRIDELASNDLLSVVVMDELTLAWITAITRQLHGIIRREAQEQGLKAGPAYRPGLGRWPLELQLAVFSRLPTEAIGVTLTEDLVMLPRQSTSLIIPFYDRS
jgi:hypothetical protein